MFREKRDVFHGFCGSFAATQIMKDAIPVPVLGEACASSVF